MMIGRVIWVTWRHGHFGQDAMMSDTIRYVNPAKGPCVVLRVVGDRQKGLGFVLHIGLRLTLTESFGF